MLQTKKRYVGFMYETEDQKEPAFDAKGIETVRRDSCLAVPKVCIVICNLEASVPVLTCRLETHLIYDLYTQCVSFYKL